MSQRIVAVVPMRHNSERINGKNYKLMAGWPLYHYILDTLCQVPAIDQIYVETDSPLIQKELPIWFPQIKIMVRPEELRGDQISMNQVLSSFVERLDTSGNLPDLILQTHVTNPFLTVETINAALDKIVHKPEADSLFTLNRLQKRFWHRPNGGNGAQCQLCPLNHLVEKLERTQDLTPIWEENSCLYIFRPELCFANKINNNSNNNSNNNNNNNCGGNNRIGTNPIFWEMNQPYESMDIDEISDFELTELLTPYYHALNQKRQNSLLLCQKKPPQLNTNIARTPLNILISAPYFLKVLDRFQPILEGFGLSIYSVPVQERLSEPDLQHHLSTRPYHAAICGDDAFTRKLLTDTDLCGQLRGICKWGTGIDSIDQVAAREMQIQVRNTPGAFSQPVAETALSYLLDWIRGTSRLSRTMHEDKNFWSKQPAECLPELTIGIVGLGEVGQRLACLLRPFGAKQVLAYDIIQPMDPLVIRKCGVTMTESLEELLSQSDIVSLNCTLTETSRHLINKTTLAQMKPGSYLINTARGGLVKTDDLVEDLILHNGNDDNGHLAGVALDVFEEEPLPADHPLRAMPASQVTLTSHNSNASALYWEKVHWNTIRNLLEVLEIPHQTKLTSFTSTKFD